MFFSSIVTIQRTRRCLRLSPNALLTPQEARVLQTLVEAGSVPMAADILGIAASTARTHVTSIFDKTGVRRQADLLRLLMAMKSPFMGQQV